MKEPAHRQDATVLLRTEHAVGRVLATTPTPSAAYPRLLAVVGASLGWDLGAAWEVAGDDPAVLACVATWRAPGAAAAAAFEERTRDARMPVGEGLPGRVVASREPAFLADLPADPNFPRAAAAVRSGLRAGFCFPVQGATGLVGAFEFFTARPGRPDDELLATMASLGGQIGQYVERSRADDAVRASEARKTAMLDAAFDAVITMDAGGLIVEVNRTAEEMFGYGPGEMGGRELAELIVPPSLRDAHRRGLERYLATGTAQLVGHPTELPAMRSDGGEFPAEIAITRPAVPGPPLFTGYLRDITERLQAEAELRSLVEEQAALRRVATLVAAGSEPAAVVASVTEEVGRLLGAHTANMVRYEPDATAVVIGEWSDGTVGSVPLGAVLRVDGQTVAARVLRSGRPERVQSYDGLEGELAQTLRDLGLRSAVGAPITFEGKLWGAVLVSTVSPEPFPEGAEERIGSFAELLAQALANAEAREELAASRRRLVQAGDAARRRLERDLHDGAQQRLVTLSLQLRLTERLLAEDPPKAREMLGHAEQELGQALAELRELARGIHPAVLTDQGLGPAITALASRTPVPVEVDAALDERPPEQVEAAAYYVVAEALTNVARYARASEVGVSVTRADGSLLVEVVDDGVGGADRAGGTGLSGLTDRVEALGGRLELSSPAGAGTTVRARIPLATG